MQQDHDVIAEAWQSFRARPQAPQVVVVSRDQQPGRGRWLADRIARLTPAPDRVLIGGARTNPAPYDWMATLLQQRGTAELPGSSQALAWLRQDTQAPPLRLEPTSLLRSAVDVVQHLVSVGPSVLVAEDVHALDPASIALLGQLCESPLPALLILATRPIDEDGYPKPAARLMKRLAEQCAPFVTLPPPPVRPAAAVVEIAWARYESARSDEVYATAATLRAAAQLLDSGQLEQARQLLTECIAASGEAARPVPEGALSRLDGSSAGNPRETVADAGGRARALAELTSREVDVLRCVAAGMSNRQVAKTLGISVRTVTVHVSNLLRKTGAGSRTEAAIWAVQHEKYRG